MATWGWVGPAGVCVPGWLGPLVEGLSLGILALGAIECAKLRLVAHQWDGWDPAHLLLKWLRARRLARGAQLGYMLALGPIEFLRKLVKDGGDSGDGWDPSVCSKMARARGYGGAQLAHTGPLERL